MRPVGRSIRAQVGMPVTDHDRADGVDSRLAKIGQDVLI